MVIHFSAEYFAITYHENMFFMSLCFCNIDHHINFILSLREKAKCAFLVPLVYLCCRSSETEVFKMGMI